MHVLLAPDSFKGSATATEVIEAIAAGWRDVRPTTNSRHVPSPTAAKAHFRSSPQPGRQQYGTTHLLLAPTDDPSSQCG